MESLSNYPFENMPISNGCFYSAIIPGLFGLFTGETLLFAVWHICFCWSVIADHYVNNSKRT